IRIADDFAWSKAFKYNVNFREACKQQDAGYSHAKVKEMALNRGTIISHDKDSSIKGFYVNTHNGVTTSPRAMTLSWNPKKPGQLRSSTGFILKRN
ncbi:MAG: hypothetical protein Q8L36_03525, partial [bacterium]|nr:hypothetical protein [bacterium]